jgi:hypothetical protein
VKRAHISQQQILQQQQEQQQRTMYWRIKATKKYKHHDLIGGEFWAAFQGHPSKCKGTVLAFNGELPETDEQYTALFEDGDIVSFSLEELRQHNICFSVEELEKKQIYAQADNYIRQHIFDLCQVHPDMLRLNASVDYYCNSTQGWDLARMRVDTERLKHRYTGK